MSKYGLLEDEQEVPNNGQPRFIVFGLGGGGGNAVEYMVDKGVSNVTFVCANTDNQALSRLTVPNLIQLGAQITRGLGAGANPKVGREAAESDEDKIRDALQGYDMVFITAGMGGGTGTGAAPVVARIAKEMGILTVAVVTTPFSYEGKRRTDVAKEGVELLSEYVDSIITISNDKLPKIFGQLPFKEGLRRADDVLLHAVNGLVQTIVTAGYINTDFNDIRTAMTAKGHAMMGIGFASGEGRATKATESAIGSPLLEDLRLENAKGLLVNITCGQLMMSEPDEIAAAVAPIVDLENGHVFYGFVEDENMGDEIHVTIIATGLTVDDRPVVPPVQPAPQPAYATNQVHVPPSYANQHSQVPPSSPSHQQVQQPSQTGSNSAVLKLLRQHRNDQ